MNPVPHGLSLLSQMINASKNPAFTINKTGAATHWNTAWLHYRGVQLEDELSAPCSAYIHPDDAAAYTTGLLTFCSTAQPAFLECRLRDKHGNYGWFRFLLSPLLSPKGAFQGGSIHLTDISEAKRQEENARKFTAIFSTPSAGIIIKDKIGRIVDWNPGSQNIMGFTLEDMRGKTSDSYTCHNNLEAIAEINRRLGMGETISFTRTEVNHKEGHKIICSTSFCPILDATREMTGSVVFFHDVTAEKLAEQKRLEMEVALQKSHRDIATILKEIPAPICVMDTGTGAVLDCNPAFIRACAAPETHIRGSLLTRYLADENGKDLTTDQILEHLRAGEEMPCALRKLDGTIAKVEIMGRPLLFQDKPAVAVHCMDLTQRLEQERALRMAAQAAEDASKMKSSFLANMSHEIRTPLNGVVGFAELALDEPGISPGMRNWLNKIKLSANGLLEIINDILDISKIESGKIELEKAPFSLHDILQVCETIITPKAEEKNITLYFYAEPLINRKFVGDQTRLRQVLLNLLSNAVKFTNVGIVKLMSNVEELSDGNVLLSFEIKDSGIGMTQEQIQKIFEPFAQADTSTTRKYGGTGLGLAITKNLVELMGGTLHVESACGIGSKFSFVLPLETVAEAPTQTAQAAHIGETLEKPQFRGTVLVCEDNIINQQVIQEHLNRVGLESVIAPNGKLGVEQIKTRMLEGGMFDLILMDIHMPIMDGLEATKKLLDMGVEIPIIALTANAMASDRKNYLSHGMTDYLAKPFRAHELWECLLRYLTPLGGYTMPAAVSSPAVPDTADQQRPTPANPVPELLTISVPRNAPATSRAPFSRPDDESDSSMVIDRMRGIENAAGNTALYTRLLANFVQDNREYVERFTEALEAGNRGLSHRMAHTLKGVAGTIGAMRVYTVARDFESALNDGKIKDVHDKLPLLQESMTALFAELALLCGTADQPTDTKSACTGDGTLDLVQAHALIDRLAPLLSAGDSESLEFIDTVNATLGALGEPAQVLAEQIAEYDFDLAHATLNDIKACLEASHD